MLTSLTNNLARLELRHAMMNSHAKNAEENNQYLSNFQRIMPLLKTDGTLLIV